jgi:AAA ATPase domain
MANPFRELGAFGEGDAGRLFGREEAVKNLLDKLRENPAVLVIGPMSSGKTSIVAAGVIPRLKSRMTSEGKNQVFLFLLPGMDPSVALLRSIHDAAVDPTLPDLGAWSSEQKKKLARSPAYLRTLLDITFPGRAVVFVVDQFDQILTFCADPKAINQFAQALIDACPDAQSPNRAVFIIGGFNYPAHN